MTGLNQVYSQWITITVGWNLMTSTQKPSETITVNSWFTISVLLFWFVCTCRPSVQNDGSPSRSLMSIWPISRAKQADPVLRSQRHKEHSCKSLTWKLWQKSGLKASVREDKDMCHPASEDAIFFFLPPRSPIAHLVFNWLLSILPQPKLLLNTRIKLKKHKGLTIKAAGVKKSGLNSEQFSLQNIT